MADKWATVDYAIKKINERKAKKQEPYWNRFEAYVDKTFNSKKM